MRKKFWIVLLSVLFFASAALAAGGRAVPGDYDGDGKTDIILIREQGGFLIWISRLATGVQNPIFIFGLKGDSVASGDYDGDADFEPAVVRSEISGLINWYTLANDASITSRQWGLKGDEIVPGYFNTDVSMDPGVVRKVGDGLQWFLTRSGESDIIGVNWGLAADTPYVGDFNGDKLDDLIAVRKEFGGHSWYVYNLGNGTSTGIQWGLAGDTTLPPYDYNGDGVDDFIVVREVQGYLTAFIRLNSSNGQAKGTEAVFFGLRGDTPFVGNFFQRKQADFGVYRTAANSNSNHFIKLPNSNDALVVPFGLSNDRLLHPNGKVSGGGNTSSAGLEAVCSQIIPPQSGMLWKPASDHSGGERVNRPVTILNKNVSRDSCLSMYNANGEEVSRLGNYSFTAKYGPRWYTGWGCGDRKFASEIVAAARATAGSNRTYLELGGGRCMGPIVATSRAGSL